MPSAAKGRAKKERDERQQEKSSSSSSKGSSSSKASASARSSGDRSVALSSSSRGRFDGNRDDNASGERNPANARVIVDPKNFDLGVGGWLVTRGLEQSTSLPPRPAPSKAGQPIKMGLNTFHVENLPSKPVYQFDVIVGNGEEKHMLNSKVWSSQAVSNTIGAGWIYDGNKLAWSLRPIDRDIKLSVDLDAEQGRKPGKKPNVHWVHIRMTNRVRLDVLLSYMDGRISFDNSCLEAINFLDHLLREWPSRNYTQIKRSFFAHGQQRHDLGGAIEAFRGVYQSMRVVHSNPKARLSINLDVANGTFWTAGHLQHTAVAVTGRRDIADLINTIKADIKNNGRFREQLRKKLKKLHIIVKHRGGEGDEYIIERLIHESARDHKFEKDGAQISIYDYFAKQYGIRLQYPDLPLVKTTKKSGATLPMEICLIKENQRYAFKLDERQTTGMLRVAAVPPPERWQAVEHGLNMLNWRQDPILGQFGLRISTDRVLADGRLLPAPKVQFGQGEAKPGTSGRWDLKGKKFLSPNTLPLKSWSVTVITGRRGGKPDKAVVEHFMKEFIKIYQSHGGRIENKQPAMTLAQGDDVGGWVTAAWNAAGNQVQSRPQMLVFILPDKNPETYGRIKRSADCRYGVVSQCMQYSHVQKAQAQYISNVCMKFNAKLGGQTARAVGAKSNKDLGMFAVPTMVIGADVSHSAPGVQAPSMAAMTVSTDKLGIRYAADCQTNGYRVEMISTDNINSVLKPLIQHWVSDVGGGKFPQRIMYLRDGVSEGQYQHVLQQEVADMKALLKTARADLNIPFVVLVGGKRHHVRFFPEKGKGDRNGNPLPGTLVETGVTHPYENDFYLCAHSAIKGTARPMHYHVLLNEPNISNEELQTLLYEQSYQYIRSTTPISQHPAIYYAHLASNRAVPHDPKWNGSSDGNPSGETGKTKEKSGSQSGSQSGAKQTGSRGKSGGSSSGMPSEFDKLLAMPNQGNIMSTMWYI